jgi:2'-5' RNA ligase
LDESGRAASHAEILRRYFNGRGRFNQPDRAEPSAIRWTLELKIEKLGVFPDAKKPRVLWCGTSGDIDKLAVLQKQLEEDFAGIGFPGEDRPFRAHLTLARIKDPRDVSGLGNALTKYATFFAGAFSVRELILFQSRLTPQGAVYTRLAAFPLAG